MTQSLFWNKANIAILTFWYIFGISELKCPQDLKQWRYIYAIMGIRGLGKSVDLWIKITYYNTLLTSKKRPNGCHGQLIVYNGIPLTIIDQNA